MGKKQQQQRTKGNVKPSSSAQAAELLAASGTTQSGFIGFGALSGDLGYVPAMQGSEEADSSVDSDFRMALRRLSKRDVTTKIKALQELTALCKDKDIEAVKSVLPFWPRIYSKIAVDNDRRVREAAQKTFEQLVLRVRRNLAPYLKTLMGPWVVAQCDIYSPAASAAKLAFQAAFSPAKQTEAVAAYRKDIIAHIEDNLVKQTASTLSDPKTTSPEDMESKYEKLLTSTLSSVRLFLTYLMQSEQTKLDEALQPLLRQDKFWKYARHKNNMVRAGFFTAMSGICHGVPATAQEFSDKLCPAVLYSLDEADPGVVASLWEAVIYVLTTVKDCWTKVNARKGVLPRLWKMLKEAGSGNASVIYPNLLPFISKVPQDITGKGLGFYQEFFNNLKAGLVHDRTSQSSTESAAITKSLTECLRYTLIISLGESGGTNLQDYLIQDQLIPLMEASVVEDNPSSETLFDPVVDLIHYLQGQQTTAADSRKSKHLSKVLNNIYSGITEVFNRHIDTEPLSGDVLDRMAGLLRCLSKQRTKDEKPSTNGRVPETSDQVTAEASQSQVDEKFEQLVVNICDKCLGKARKFKSTLHLRLLNEIFCAELHERVLISVLRTLICSNSDDLCVLIRTFCTSTLLPWLQDAVDQWLEAVPDLVRIFVALFIHVPKEQAAFLVDQVHQVSDGIAVLYHITKTIVEETPAGTSLWLQGESFRKALLETVEKLMDKMKDPAFSVTPDTEYQMGLVRYSMVSVSGGNEFLTSSELEKILTQLYAVLPPVGTQENELPAAEAVIFVCDITKHMLNNSKVCFSSPCIADAQWTMFLLSDAQIFSDEISVALKETSLTCVKAMNCEIVSLQTTSLYNQWLALYEQVQEYLATVNITSIQRLKAACTHVIDLLKATTDGLAEGKVQLDESPYLDKINIRFLSPAHVPDRSQWMVGHMINNTLTATDPSMSWLRESLKLGKTFSLGTDQEFAHSMLQSAVSVSWLSHIHQRGVMSPEGVDGMSLADCSVQIAHQVSLLAGGLSALTLSKRTCAQNTDLTESMTFIEDQFLALITLIDNQEITAVLESISDDNSQNSLQVAAAADWAHLLLQKSGAAVDVMTVIGSLDRYSDLDQGNLNLLEVSLRYINKNLLTQLIELHVAKVVSCHSEDAAEISGMVGSLSVLAKSVMLVDAFPFSQETGALDSEMVVGLMKAIQAWRDQHEQLFILEGSIQEADSHRALFACQLIDLMTAVVTKFPQKLDDTIWDTILCCLTSWIQVCQESEDDLLESAPVQAVAVSVFRLLAAVAGCFKSVVPLQSDHFPSSLLTEWQEFFCQGIFTVLLPLFINLTGKLSNSESLDMGSDLLLTAMSDAVSYCPLVNIMETKLPPKLAAGEDKLPDDVQTLLNHLTPLLTAPSTAVQQAAFKMLLKVLPELVVYDQKENTDEDQEKTRSPPVALVTILKHCSLRMDMILLEADIGDHVTIPAFTDEYTSSLGYMFTWQLLLHFFNKASSELRVEYAAYLKETEAVDKLIVNLFCLMPENPVVPLKEAMTSQSPLQKLSSTKNLFSEDPVYQITSDPDNSFLQHVTCSVYMHALRDLPAIIRQWWNSQDKRTAGIVEKYTSKYVSPILSSQEIASVKGADATLENMTIKGRPAAREVVAVYSVDEVSVELVTELATNHPLGQMVVNCGKKIGVSNTQWRNWMLQLTTFLAHQNGSIVDGLRLWKKNVDKRFEGVEDCMICFSVIHGTNCQLPKIQCRTCKKKFHSACLYKWFNTSNKSTCPLCRNLF